MRSVCACLLSCIVLLYVVVTIQACASFAVRRNVKEYGARGDGVTDDTAAIQSALTDGRSDKAGGVYPKATYSPSTQHPAYVFFPPGTYKVTSSLPVIYYTQMVGEPSNLPVIKYVSSSSAQQRVLEVAGSWYNCPTCVNQNNFYRQIRNFVIDMTNCTNCIGVHWQVAQATSITNVYFKAGIGTQNQGIWMENGSGGFISDLVFEGGIYGLWVGNQQFTSRNITIRNTQRAGIFLNWDWLWTFKNVQISNTPVAIDVTSATGSVVVLDSHFINTSIGVRTLFSTATEGVNAVLIDNLKFETSNASAIIVQDSGQAILHASAGTTTVKSWAQGSIWRNCTAQLGTIDLSSITPHRPRELVTSTGAYFEKTRPLFIGVPTVDVTTIGVVADGSDISGPLQHALHKYAHIAVLFFPYGIYIIGRTVVIPPGTRMLGEVWSVLAADGNGTHFQDANNPQPMLKVGTPGQRGVAQLVDFIISHRAPQPGAKLIEWNLHDPAEEPGSNGMWDVHFRIGGALPTNITPVNCPNDNGTHSPSSVCTGTWGMLHITSSGNCYLENVWGWTADHDIDQQNQLNAYNARGFLCESQGPVWAYGTAFEHNLLYQYNLDGAKNIFLGAIQTETPYFQPSTLTPFAPTDEHDPTYCTNDPRCNMAYGLVIHDSTAVYVYSAGLYSFFNVWSQACLPSACQINVAKITSSTWEHVHVYALSTYGSQYSLSTAQPYSLAESVVNKNTFCSTAIVAVEFF